MIGIMTTVPTDALNFLPSSRFWGNPQYFALFIMGGRMEKRRWRPREMCTGWVKSVQPR